VISNTPVQPRTQQEETLQGILNQTDLRLAQLERAYQGPQRKESVVVVGTFADLPEPQADMYAWIVDTKNWWGVVGGTWTVNQRPPNQPPDPAVFRVDGVLTTQVGATTITNNDGVTRTITNVRAVVKSPHSGANIIVDVDLNSTTIFSTQANRPSIPDTTDSDTSVPNTTSWPSGQSITLDIDSVGSVVPGSDLVVRVNYTLP